MSGKVLLIDDDCRRVRKLCVCLPGHAVFEPSLRRARWHRLYTERAEAYQRFSPPLDFRDFAKVLVTLANDEIHPVMATMQPLVDKGEGDAGIALFGLNGSAEETVKFVVNGSDWPLARSIPVFNGDGTCVFWHRQRGFMLAQLMSHGCGFIAATKVNAAGKQSGNAVARYRHRAVLDALPKYLQRVAGCALGDQNDMTIRRRARRR